MNVHTINSQSALTILPENVERLVKSFLKWKNIHTDEVTIHFIDKEEITRLHDEHFQDPTHTDCISFPIDSPEEEGSGYFVLGEIFICPEVGIEYAKKNGDDPYREVSLYLIHGLLHLLGFDDQDEESLSIMRAQETSAMISLEKNKELLHA